MTAAFGNASEIPAPPPGIVLLSVEEFLNRAPSETPLTDELVHRQCDESMRGLDAAQQPFYCQHVEQLIAHARQLERELAESERNRREENAALSHELRVWKESVPSAIAHTVWVVENKTSVVLFVSEEDAQAYVSSFGTSTGGGMTITEIPVCRADNGSDK